MARCPRDRLHREHSRRRTQTERKATPGCRTYKGTLSARVKAESWDYVNCGCRLLPLGATPSGGENKDRVDVGAHGCPPLPRTCARVVRAGTVSGPEVVG